MTTVGGTTANEVCAADPTIVSNEVADYSSVPPVASLSPPQPLGDAKPSNVQITPQLKEWDYGQNGGADFNMEAPILEEDVVRAGGFGARDELDSFLPAAVDATDYEETLKDAMRYEDESPHAEGEISRPGVGFVKAQQQEMDGFREVE